MQRREIRTAGQKVKGGACGASKAKEGGAAGRGIRMAVSGGSHAASVVLATCSIVTLAPWPSLAHASCGLARVRGGFEGAAQEVNEVQVGGSRLTSSQRA